MKASKVAAAAAFIAAASLVLGGCAGGSAIGGGADADSDCSQPGTTGVTDDTIKLGTTVPLSGALSVYGGIAAAQQAYYDMVNEQGGVTSKDGKTREIELTVLDDVYDPSKAKTNVDELVNRDEVFAISGAFGTSTQLAARPVVEEACVPDVWIGSGNPQISDVEHPLLIGLTVVTEVEGQVIAQYLTENSPEAKVAILAQNGDYGAPFLEGFNETIEGTKVEVVATETYEPTDTDVRQQVTTLAASGADAFFVVANGTTVLQAMNNAHALGWDAQILVPAGASVNLDLLSKLDPGAADGALIGSIFKDVGVNADDPAVALYLEELAKQPNASTYSPGQIIAGWLTAQLSVAILEGLETVDRQSFIDAVHDFSYDEDTVLHDGIPLLTTEDSAYIVRGMQLDRYDATNKTLTKEDVVVLTEE